MGSFVEDGQRKLGREANTRTESKQNKHAGQPTVSGREQGQGERGSGACLGDPAQEGDRGFH